MSATDALELVAIGFGMTTAEIIGPRRWPRHVAARAMVASLLRGDGWSYPEIGRALKRHHTTVMHLLNARGTGKRAA